MLPLIAVRHEIDTTWWWATVRLVAEACLKAQAEPVERGLDAPVCSAALGC